MPIKRKRNPPRSPLVCLSIGLISTIAVLTYSAGYYWSSNAFQQVTLAQTDGDLRASHLLRYSKDLSLVTKSSKSQLLHEHFEALRLECLRDLQDILHNLFKPYLEGKTSRVVLVDVAIHSNLGDNILWKAAAKLVTDFGISPALICYVTQPSWVEFIDSKFPQCVLADIVNMVKDGGVVLLHAGGNWGDLYRFVQEGRLQYLKYLTAQAENNNFTIVQLPQSISYSDNSKSLIEDDQTIASFNVSNFVLFTRQEDSFAFAKAHYPDINTKLSPDIAYILGPILPSRRPQFDVIIQMRQDKEVRKSDEQLYEWIKAEFTAANMTFDYRDWWYHVDDHIGEISATVPSLLGDVRLKAAVDMISNGKILITNRLHGSIVAALLGRYTLVVDTVEGKLGKVNNVVTLMSSKCSTRILHRASCGSLREAVLSAIELYQSWNGDTFYY